MIKNIILLLVLSGIALGQSVDTQMRLTNSVYVLEEQDESQIRLYQQVRLQSKFTNLYNLKFNFMGRVFTDLSEDFDDEKRFNAYRMSLSASNLFNNLLDFEVGRQFLHPGTPLGGIDGLNLVVKPLDNLNLQLYGGVESNLWKGFKIYNYDQAAVLGGVVTYKNFLNTTWQALYLQKSRESENQWQIAGLNLMNRFLNDFTFILQGHYDLVNSRLHRMYFSTRWSPNREMSFGVNFKQQYPQIYGDSYFKIFDVKEYRLIGAYGYYAVTPEIGLTANVNMIQLSDGNGIRAVVSANNKNGSVGLAYETGDLGDEMGVVVGYTYDILPDLVASVSIDYTRYRFEDIYDYEAQLANAARLSYDISDHWKTDLEYQWLNSRFKDADHRLLNHIHFIW